MRRAAADLVDGVLVLDKPLGVSSNLALQKARRLLQARKAGHTGTLDPMASGLLPLTFGEATKFSVDLLEAEKHYEARLELGVTTRTGDTEGEVLARRPVHVSRAQVEEVLARFVGPGQQVPPMHSALKRNGRPLYELARLGQEVARAPRPVEIRRIELSFWEQQQLGLEIVCSKGTYVRVLAQDIGEALGCGAHLAGLRRTRVGPLSLTQAVALERLEAQCLQERRAHLLPVDSLLTTLPRISLDARDAARLLHGQAVCLRSSAVGDAPRLRVYDSGARLLGVGSCRGGWLRATRLVGAAGAMRHAPSDEPHEDAIEERT